ncbi:MAG TPA: hypothetical protein VH134_13020 [Candidatus Dormibacteraeota bacterium]|nr:hypothetical protein [Candidatus Dormibacteraeota bacterium]
MLARARSLRLPQRRPPTACPRCATPVRTGLAVCPLCGEPMTAVLDGTLERWRRRGALEFGLIALVLLVFLVCFLVVFAHR